MSLLGLRQDVFQGHAGHALLEQQRGRVIQRSSGEAVHGAIAVPQAQCVGLVLGLPMAPPNLEHQLLARPVAGRRDPGALPAGKARIS